MEPQSICKVHSGRVTSFAHEPIGRDAQHDHPETGQALNAEDGGAIFVDAYQVDYDPGQQPGARKYRKSMSGPRGLTLLRE